MTASPVLILNPVSNWFYKKKSGLKPVLQKKVRIETGFEKKNPDWNRFYKKKVWFKKSDKHTWKYLKCPEPQGLFFEFWIFINRFQSFFFKTGFGLEVRYKNLWLSGLKSALSPDQKTGLATIVLTFV